MMDILVVSTDNVISDGEWAYDPALYKSIEKHGQIYPAACVEHGAGKYKLVDGRRRHAILKKLGRDIKIVVLSSDEDVDEQLALLPDIVENEYIVTLAGNIHNSNGLSEAHAVIAAVNDGRDKQWFLDNFGYSSARVDRLLALGSLVQDAQELVMSGKLSMSAAFRICKLTTREQYTVLRDAKNKKGKVTVANVVKVIKRIKAEKNPQMSVSAPSFLDVRDPKEFDKVVLVELLTALMDIVTDEEAEMVARTIDIVTGERKHV